MVLTSLTTDELHAKGFPGSGVEESIKPGDPYWEARRAAEEGKEVEQEENIEEEKEAEVMKQTT